MIRLFEQRQIYCVLIFSGFLNVLTHSIRCINCHNIENQSLCNKECEGDFCVLWKFREMSKDYKLQGCISGLETMDLPMGCRKNRVGAILCLCDSNDYCNEDRLQYMSEENTKILPKNLRCTSFTRAQFMSTKRTNLARLCESDFCHFRQKTTNLDSATNDMLESASCGQMPQYNFDLLIGPLWPMIGLRANACYRLEIQFSQVQTTCVCSTNNCNQRIPFEIAEAKDYKSKNSISQRLTRCHVTFGDMSDEELLVKMNSKKEILKYCTGEYCIIQKAEIPNYGIFYSKGCVSASYLSGLRDGYRNVLDVEQWLCSTEFCNFNVEFANKNGINFMSQLYFANIRDNFKNISERRTTSWLNFTIAANSIGGRVKAQNSVNQRLFKNVAMRNVSALIPLTYFLKFLLFFKLFYVDKVN